MLLYCQRRYNTLSFKTIGLQENMNRAFVYTTTHSWTPLGIFLFSLLCSFENWIPWRHLALYTYVLSHKHYGSVNVTFSWTHVDALVSSDCQSKVKYFSGTLLLVRPATQSCTNFPSWVAENQEKKQFTGWVRTVPFRGLFCFGPALGSNGQLSAEIYAREF